MIDKIPSKVTYLRTGLRCSARGDALPAVDESARDVRISLQDRTQTRAATDPARLNAIRDAIKNKTYPLDFQKLADCMAGLGEIGLALGQVSSHGAS